MTIKATKHKIYKYSKHSNNTYYLFKVGWNLLALSGWLYTRSITGSLFSTSAQDKIFCHVNIKLSNLIYDENNKIDIIKNKVYNKLF